MIRWRVCPVCGYRTQGPPGLTHVSREHAVVATIPYLPRPSLADLEDEVARLGPPLRRTHWEHVGARALALVLETTELTLAQLEAYAGPGKPRAEALAEQLAGERGRFRRET